MADERTRWTDDRLDDRFETVDETVSDLKHEIHALRNLPNAVSNLATELHHTRGDVDRGFTAVRELGEKFDEHVTERRQEDELQRKERKAEAERKRVERKADRRWMVGSALTAAGLAIAAVGLLADKL